MKKTTTYLFLILIILFSSTLLFSVPVNAIDDTYLIARWTFNDGTAMDSSGNNHHGTIHGAQPISGPKGNALRFNGVDNYIEIPDHPSLNGFTEFTVSCWFRVHGFNIWEPILNKGGYNEYTTDVFEVNVNYQGLIHFVLNFETTGRTGYNTPAGIIKIDTWHHLVGSWDGDILNIYIDGILVQIFDTPNEPLKTSDSTLQIGLEYENPDQSYFNGDIDDIYIYSRALTAEESTILYTRSGIGSSPYRSLQTNRAIERSILYGLVPRPIVPIIATVTSIILLILWNLFGSIIMDFISDYTSERILDIKEKQKVFTERLDHISLPIIPMKTSELLNLFLVIIIFSITMSWTWAATLDDILSMFILNILSVGSILTIRELYRIHYSKTHEIETYHIFWPFGSLLTIASTFLGNTFSLASDIAGKSEQDEPYPRMLFQSTVILSAISLSCFTLNFFIGHIILQMISVFTIMMLMIDMTPIKPMDGAHIKQWNTPRWLVLYLIIAISYMVMNFNLI
jgi:hypothetical protein